MDVPELIEVPRNWSALFELIQEQHGCFEPNPGEEWYQTRMRWAGILRRVCTKRHCEVRDLAIASWWVSETGGTIGSPFALFDEMPVAKRKYAEQRRALARERVLRRRGDLISEAYDMGATDWAERLQRAADSDFEAVVDGWTAERDRLKEGRLI